MLLFGWYTHRPGFCFSFDEGGGGGGGAAVADAPASSGGEPPPSAGGGFDEEGFQRTLDAGGDPDINQLKEGVKAFARNKGDRAKAVEEARSQGKLAQHDDDQMAPRPGMPGLKRDANGRFVPVGKADTNGHAPGTQPNGKPRDPAVPDGKLLRPETGAQPAAPAAAPTPGAPAPAAPAPASGFTDQHYAWGNHFGLTKAQVETFGSPGQFEGWLRRVAQPAGPSTQQTQQPAQQPAQQQFQQVQLQDGRTAYVPVQQPAPQPVQQPQQQQFQPVQLPDGRTAYVPVEQAAPHGALQQLLTPYKLDEGVDWEPGIVNFVKHHNSVVAAIGQQIAPLLAMAPQLQQLGGMIPALQTMQQTLRQQQVREMEHSYEQAFASVDKELFGEGTFLKADPAQQNARVKASDVITGLITHYQRRGEALPPLQTLVEQARAAVWPERIRNAALTAAAAKSKELRGQTTAVPTSREPSPLSPEERAIQVARQFMRENGAPGE